MWNRKSVLRIRILNIIIYKIIIIFFCLQVFGLDRIRTWDSRIRVNVIRIHNTVENFRNIFILCITQISKDKILSFPLRKTVRFQKKEREKPQTRRFSDDIQCRLYLGKSNCWLPTICNRKGMMGKKILENIWPAAKKRNEKTQKCIRFSTNIQCRLYLGKYNCWLPTICNRKGMMGKKMLENIWPTAWEPCPIRATAIWIL